MIHHADYERIVAIQLRKARKIRIQKQPNHSTKFIIG